MVYTIRQGGKPVPWKVISQVDLKIKMIALLEDAHIIVHIKITDYV